VLSTYSFAVRFDVLSEAWRSASKLGLMIIVIVEMSPRHDVIGSNDGRGPSNPMKGRGMFWTLPKHWKLWQVVLWRHWSTYEEKGLQVEERVALSRSSMRILSLYLRGT
jgi:hypothetical protein